VLNNNFNKPKFLEVVYKPSDEGDYEGVGGSTAGFVMIKYILQAFDVNLVDAGSTGYWVFCLLSFVPGFCGYFLVYYFSRIQPRLVPSASNSSVFDLHHDGVLAFFPC
jgi:hypothetical protein